MKISTKKTGIISGLVSGICWALDTILLGYVLLISPFENFVFLAPFLSTFLHDSFSALWVFIYLLFTKQANKIIPALKTKSGWFIVLAAICGGPLGMTGYLFSIHYIGSAYTATISAMYPAVGAFFGYLFLKDKLSKKGMLGLCLAIISTILLGFSTPDNPQNLLIGFICALVCVFGWGLECVICSYGMGEDVNSDVALQIRQLTSAIIYACIILPFVGGYAAIPHLISNKAILLGTGVVAFIGSASYLCYYKAISLIGPTRAMALNISYSAWAIFLGVLFFNQKVSFMLFIPCLLIITGSIMTARDQNEDI